MVLVGAVHDDMRTVDAVLHTNKAARKSTSSELSFRNNFEHKESRKAILKNALVEIKKEISTH